MPVTNLNSMIIFLNAQLLPVQLRPSWAAAPYLGSCIPAVPTQRALHCYALHYRALHSCTPAPAQLHAKLKSE